MSGGGFLAGDLFVEYWRGEDRQWYWHARNTHNHQIVFTGGEGYTRKWSAKRAARKAIKDA